MYSEELYAQVELMERKINRRSAIITLILVLLGSASVLIYDLVRPTFPPPGVKEYEMIGAFDFGNYTEGSRQVNNFEDPVENPTEAPQQDVSEPEPVPEQTAQPEPTPVAESTPTATDHLTVTDPADIKVPDPPSPVKEDPSPNETVKETKTEPKETTNNTQNNTTTTTTTSSNTSNQNNSTTGSNHGNADSGTGNQGAPDIKKLDPNGMYSFGEGAGGLKGRAPLSLPNPKYSSQEEGVLTFTLRIEPDGSVSYVKAGPTTKLALKQAGINAIRKWKFSKVPSSQGAQMVTVKITFQLKG